MTDAYTRIQEWPKMLSRPKPEGGIERRAFNSPDEVPADGGWTDSATARANAKPAPPPQTRNQQREAKLERDLAQTLADLHESNGMRAKAEAAAHDARNALHAEQTKNADLMAFVAMVRKVDGAPADVIAAADAFLKPPPPEKPRPLRQRDPESGKKGG